MLYETLKTNSNPQVPGSSNPTKKRNMALLTSIIAAALAGISFGSAAVPITFGIIALTGGIGLAALLASNPVTLTITAIAVAVGILAIGVAIAFGVVAKDLNKQSDREKAVADMKNTFVFDENAKEDLQASLTQEIRDEAS